MKKNKTGPKPENGVGRVRLQGTAGPNVSVETRDTLDLWRTVYGVAHGRAIDDMVAFCKDNPAFKLKVGKPPFSL